MTLDAVPAGFSSDAVLTLLRTLRTVASSNDSFMTTTMSSISAHVNTTLSADAMFSILKTIAASQGRIVSTLQNRVEQESPEDGSAGDLAWQFGATAAATATTTGVQVSTASAAGATTTQVSVTAASVRVRPSPGSGSDPGAAFIQEYMQNYVADNSLSSKQISDTLYAGGSLGDPAVQTAGSFEDVINGLADIADDDSRSAANVAAWLADGRPDSIGMGFDGQSDAQVLDAIAEMNDGAAHLDAEANALTAAFRNHTLTFQKASDVEGLGFSETVRGSAFVGRAGIDRSSTLDQDFLKQDADGKQHTLFSVGSVEMYATW